MERELWARMAATIDGVQTYWIDDPRLTYGTAVIVQVFLWAVLHDRPIDWACRGDNWTDQTRPERLPSQPTMSRRLRTRAVDRFLRRLANRLGGRLRRGLLQGYKLFTLWSNRYMPIAWEIALLASPFGRDLYACRTAVERQFSQLSGFGGGLGPLQNWVRRQARVHLWVHGKLMFNAIRLRMIRA